MKSLVSQRQIERATIVFKSLQGLVPEYLCSKFVHQDSGYCLRDSVNNVPVNSKTAHAAQTPGHLTFLKNFGQIPHYVACLDGQMPHLLELQRGSNAPPSWYVNATVQNVFPCVKPFILMFIMYTPDILKHSRNVENTRQRLMFPTFLECSQMSGVFNHSVMQG